MPGAAGRRLALLPCADRRPGAAFEAAQNTFVRAVTGIRRFRGDAPVRVWLLVLARRAVADLLHAERRRVDRPTRDPLPDVRVTDPARAVDTLRLLDRLPEDQRQAFTLTQLLGLTYEQAAEVAGCRVGTIRSRVFRARDRLVTAVQADDTEEKSDARF